MAEFVIEMHLRQGLLVTLTVSLLSPLGPADVEGHGSDDGGKEEGIPEDRSLGRFHGIVGVVVVGNRHLLGALIVGITGGKRGTSFKIYRPTPTTGSVTTLGKGPGNLKIFCAQGLCE